TGSSLAAAARSRASRHVQAACMMALARPIAAAARITVTVEVARRVAIAAWRVRLAPSTQRLLRRGCTRIRLLDAPCSAGLDLDGGAWCRACFVVGRELDE